MRVAFVEGRVFVGDGRVLEKATVVVEGERIAKVSCPGGRVPGDAVTVPLEGRTLLPGLIDCHVHLCIDASPDPMRALSGESSAISAFKAAEFARRTLAAGVTTVRDMGGRDGIDLALRDAIRSGWVAGPRVLASGRMICMTGGHGWPLGREADGPDEVAKAVREQIKAGADVVKLMATGGVMTPGVEPGAEQLTAEELRAGVGEAHKAGRKTATHAMGTRGILNAVRAGIDSVEHGVFLDEEAASLMVRQGVALVPTLSALHGIDRHGLEGGIPAFAVEKTRRVKPHHLESLRRARAAGVIVALGTDAGTPYNRHGENLGELLRLLGSGYSPSEALQAGTGIAARVLGLEGLLGTVEEGKLADLVVVAGDPLEDVGLLCKPGAVQLVMQGGKWVTGLLAEQTAGGGGT